MICSAEMKWNGSIEVSEIGGKKERKKRKEKKTYKVPQNCTQVQSTDPGETHPGAAQTYGQAAPGCPPVCLPALDWS